MGSWSSVTLWPRKRGRYEFLYVDITEYARLRMGKREKFTIRTHCDGSCDRLLRLLHGHARRANYRLTVRSGRITRFEFEPRTVQG